MLITTEFFIVILSLLASNEWVTSFENLEVTEHDKLLDKLLQTLQQISKFYNREYQNVNLDSIYGVRVAEGALKSTLEDIDSGASQYPTPKIRFTISNLYSQFSGIARKSLHYLERTSPEYYHKFSKVVAEQWSYFKDYKRLDYSQAISLKDKKEIDFEEELSDSCMVGLMGSANKTSEPCEISEKCWKLMSTRGYKEYVTTHQALFFILGDIQGCRKQLESRLEASTTNPHNIEDMLGLLCADIYPEMVNIEEQGYPIQQRDLFMEQGIVCGMLGYYDYLDKERLEKIMSWKIPQGCYGFRSKREALREMGEPDEDEDEYGNNHVSFPKTNVYNKRKLMSMDTRRKLLMESALTGGCLAHMTGVAVGLLGVYVKWMISSIGQDDDTSPGTRVIKARSIYSYEPPIAESMFNLWPLAGLVLTVGIVAYFLLWRQARRLIKGIWNLSPRTQKDIKYIA